MPAKQGTFLGKRRRQDGPCSDLAEDPCSS